MYRPLLVQSGRLQSAAINRSDTGDEQEQWTTHRKDVPCLVRPLTTEADLPIGLSEAVTHLIHMEPDAEVLTGRWRIIIEGRTYRFADVRDPGHRGHHFEVLARRVEDEGA